MPPASAADNSLACVGQAISRRYTRSLRLVLVITATIMGAEFVGGWLSNSLALMADAGHMLTDSAAVALALLASWIAERPATLEKTFGYLRLEILAALVNGAVLFVLAATILWHAVERLTVPPEINASVMFGVAAVGLVANAVALAVLHRGRDESLNVRGAYLHIMGDLLGSVGVLLAGAVVLLTGWTVADPAVSVFISLLIMVGAWRLVRESVDVLLEATPKHIDLGDVARAIADVAEVWEVHDLHVWTVTSGIVAMSGHAVVQDPQHNQRVLETVQSRLAEMGINHVTLQIENREDVCGQGCC
jgi:cobalt-zinc-cadmium efflux system protein